MDAKRFGKEIGNCVSDLNFQFLKWSYATLEILCGFKDILMKKPKHGSLEEQADEKDLLCIFVPVKNKSQ